MKSKKENYVNDDQNLSLNEQSNKEVSIDEQLELFAELLVDYYLNHLEDEN